MTAERKKPELLAPAGDWEKLQMAVLYGADAVYLAGTSFGMRSFAGNFSDEELPRAVDFAHRHGVKVHATVNTMPRSGEVDRLPEHLEKLNDAGVDALILADLGAFTLAGKYAPRCQRHISTQQSIANYACAQAWFDLGAQRVVLARELGMEDTSFANPSGLDDDGHYSTARDMARLAVYAAGNHTFARLCSTRSVTIGGRTMTNHNRLLRAVPGCIGMKTGYTRAAGRTLVSAAERDGRRLVAVTLQDGNDWADHAALYDWGFAQPAGQETADHRREDTP